MRARERIRGNAARIVINAGGYDARPHYCQEYQQVPEKMFSFQYLVH
jgi:hypothetical protein